jgi:hypothetical protein
MGFRISEPRACSGEAKIIRDPGELMQGRTAHVSIYRVHMRDGLCCRLLRHLAADFAAFVRLGVDIDVPFSGQQVGSLSVCERG